MHSGLLVYKYMFFCTSASLWCVLGGEGKKVATEKKERKQRPQAARHLIYSSDLYCARSRYQPRTVPMNYIWLQNPVLFLTFED
ncbi:hypothetical protein GRJ2_002340900 [Grus japonensis]|uniref:Secreted protein n=1 Tax=Grus japonensis TaxID=30415 RepID=A0ABC9XM41_GRUJA